MSEQKKKAVDLELERSTKRYDTIVRVCLLAGIIIVSGFIIYYILFPQPGYVTFGLLNANQEAENYQTQASIGEDIEFYATVDNYLGSDFTFRLKIYKGDNNTELSSSGSNNAVLNQTLAKVTIVNGQKWMSEKLTISFYQIGSNQTIIVELWQYTDATTEQFYDIVWQRLNITA